MRKLSSLYSVSYEVIDKNNVKIKQEINASCYSRLYSSGISIEHKLLLNDFLTEETQEYSKIYIEKLAEICDLKLNFISENSIELIGFKNKFYIKLFTTLFRILFEIYPGYKENNYKERTIEFLKNYNKEENNSEYEDILERLIYYYQKSKMYNGPGHGISFNENQILLIKNIQQLRDWEPEIYNNDLQSFFSKEN